MYKFLAKIILLSYENLSWSEKLWYYLESIGKITIVAFLLNLINLWFQENQQFSLFLCLALLVNMAVGVVYHKKRGTFNWLEFFKSNSVMMLAVCVTYIMLEMLRYTAGDNTAGEFFRVTIQVTTLLYPTSKVLKNIFILTAGKYPPEFIMTKLYNFEKSGDLSELFKNKKEEDAE